MTDCMCMSTSSHLQLRHVPLLVPVALSSEPSLQEEAVGLHRPALRDSQHTLHKATDYIMISQHIMTAH